MAGQLSSARRLGVGAILLALITTLLLCALPAQAADDPTVTRRARLSEKHRTSIDIKTWRAAPHGKDISWRESHDVCSAVSANGDHLGKWQMTLSLWRGFGGRHFARSPERASCHEQDRVARRIWIDQWWWPWGG